MELPWDDLARSTDSIESSAWNARILDERCRVADGIARFTDWERSKAEIRRKVK